MKAFHELATLQPFFAINYYRILNVSKKIIAVRIMGTHKDQYIVKRANADEALLHDGKQKIAPPV